MLDSYIYGLEPIIGFEVIKEDPQTFEEACALAEWISKLSNLVGGGGNSSKWCETLDYTPIELDSIGAS